jgi:hypothetical protein
MADSAQKKAFAQNIQNMANELAALQDRWTGAYNVQVARGWDPGGLDPIIDSDIEGASITAAQLNSFLSTLRLRFTQLMSGQAVVGVVAGRSVTDAIRSDL